MENLDYDLEWYELSSESIGHPQRDGAFGLLSANKQLAAESYAILYGEALLHIRLHDKEDQLLDALGSHASDEKKMTPTAIKNFHNCLKSFQNILLELYTASGVIFIEQFVLDQLSLLLHYICDVYVVDGRAVNILVDYEYIETGVWFDNFVEILKKHSGKSTRISVRTPYITDEAWGILQSFCEEHGLEVARAFKRVLLEDEEYETDSEEDEDDHEGTDAGETGEEDDGTDVEDDDPDVEEDEDATYTLGLDGASA